MKQKSFESLDLKGKERDKEIFLSLTKITNHLNHITFALIFSITFCTF